MQARFPIEDYNASDTQRIIARQGLEIEGQVFTIYSKAKGVSRHLKNSFKI